VHAAAVTASQSIPAGHLSMCSVQWLAVTTVACTAFRVRSTFHTCLDRYGMAQGPIDYISGDPDSFFCGFCIIYQDSLPPLADMA